LQQSGIGVPPKEFAIAVHHKSSPQEFIIRVRHGSSSGIVYVSSRQMKNRKKLPVYVM
jgi:hypothetical protein